VCAAALYRNWDKYTKICRENELNLLSKLDCTLERGLLANRKVDEEIMIFLYNGRDNKSNNASVRKDKT
jgi:hypothetical protein